MKFLQRLQRGLSFMNKREKGYIYIFTIILISILAIFFYFIYSYLSNSTNISKNRLDGIQANYAAESVLNMKITEENFEEELSNFIFSDTRKRNLSVNSSPKDTEVLSMSLSKSDYLDKDKKESNYVDLKANVKYKNTLASSNMRAKYINKIYEEKDGILNSGKVSTNYLEKIRQAYEDESWINKSSKVIVLDGDFIYAYPYILEEVEEYDEETDSFIKKRNKVYKIKSTEIIVQNSGSLSFESGSNYQIFILNDKVLFNDNVISGIIILKENAQISNNLGVDGYLINLYDKELNISVEYSKRVFEIYGYLLPEYIKFQPMAINYNEIEDNT